MYNLRQGQGIPIPDIERVLVQRVTRPPRHFHKQRLLRRKMRPESFHNVLHKKITSQRVNKSNDGL